MVFGALTHVLSLEVLLIRNKANPDTKPQAKITALYFAVFSSPARRAQSYCCHLGRPRLRVHPRPRPCPRLRPHPRHTFG